MQSVFEQTFTDYEYIIIDGGSTDGSKEYIEQHADKLAYWVSEKDTGIYPAMNKGIRVSNGQYLIFLNSGDYFYSPLSLSFITKEETTDIIYGNLIVNDGSNMKRTTYPETVDFEYFYKGNTLPHQASFIKKELFEKYGLYNEQLQMLSDREFFMNAVCLYNVTHKYVPVDISVFSLDGFCSAPENQYLYGVEADLILRNNYPAFISLVDERNQLKGRLRLIKSSRMHQAVEWFMNRRIYKSVKSLFS